MPSPPFSGIPRAPGAEHKAPCVVKIPQYPCAMASRSSHPHGKARGRVSPALLSARKAAPPALPHAPRCTAKAQKPFRSTSGTAAEAVPPARQAGFPFPARQAPPAAICGGRACAPSRRSEKQTCLLRTDAFIIHDNCVQKKYFCRFAPRATGCAQALLCL